MTTAVAAAIPVVRMPFGQRASSRGAKERSDLARALAMALLVHLLVFAVLFVSVSSTDDTSASAPTPVIAAGLVDLSGLSPDVVDGTAQPQVPVAEKIAAAAQPSPPTSPEPVPSELEPAPQDDSLTAVSEQPPSDSAPSSADTSVASATTLGGMTYSDEERKQRVLALRKANRTEEKPEQDTYVRGRVLPSRSPAINAVLRVVLPEDSNEVERERLARYQADLQEAFLKYWVRPGVVPVGQACRITLERMSAGEPVDVRVDETCPFDETGRQAITDAIRQAQLLQDDGHASVLAQPLSLEIEAFDR